MALPQALSNWNVLGVEQRIEPHISYCNPHTDPPQWELSYWFPLAAAFLLRPPFFPTQNRLSAARNVLSHLHMFY